MNATLVRRIEQLERAIPAGPPGPCFIMAPDNDAATRKIARLKGERPPKTLFVMICAGVEGRCQ